MTNKPTRTQHDLDLELIESIDVDSGLSEWEAEFVSDMIGRLRGNATATLTNKQRAKAEQIQRRLDDDFERIDFGGSELEGFGDR